MLFISTESRTCTTRYGSYSWQSGFRCLPPPSRADDAEERAAKFVDELDGMVIRDDKRPGKPVVKASVYASRLTDAGVKEFAVLKSLTSLGIGATAVTNAGLKHLADFLDSDRTGRQPNANH